jgi:hypothetical protein
MKLAEKLANLNPTQQEKLEALEDSAAFDAFLLETDLTLTDEEKAEVLATIEGDKVPLADDELDDVAGGKMWGKKLKRAIMRTL